MSEADDLVLAYPTAAAQLRGPVRAYLSKLGPFPTRQSLYMAVFYPVARGWPLDRKFPAAVQKANPGIVTVGDYVRKVDKSRAPRPADADSLAALGEVASAIGVPWEWLSRLVQFESGWNPAARNAVTGARGLIQFMPRTARALGFVAVSLGAVMLMVGIAWYFLR